MSDLKSQDADVANSQQYREAICVKPIRYKKGQAIINPAITVVPHTKINNSDLMKLSSTVEKH